MLNRLDKALKHFHTYHVIFQQLGVRDSTPSGFSLPHCRVRCLKVVNQMSYLTVGSLENTSRLVDVSLNRTINSTG